jgi:hypothetical protein
MIAILLASTPSLAASTLTVDPSSSGAYTTIQSAISASASGDTIQVISGTYYECIDFSVRLVLDDDQRQRLLQLRHHRRQLRDGDPHRLHRPQRRAAGRLHRRR